MTWTSMPFAISHLANQNPDAVLIDTTRRHAQVSALPPAALARLRR